ncbi:MAG: glycosyltransferase family 39 protein [Planctomycetota bacterium]|nr:glycosyltransferase family 39 protein [Planctomycetota bacterium]
MTVAPASAEKPIIPEDRAPHPWPRWATLSASSIIFLAAILRIFRWVHWRALWLDEIYLAESISRRGLAALLFKPLEDWQLAPPGFLVAERLVASVFGTGERSLRLFPLFMGLAALPLFFAVTRRVLGPRGGVFAMSLFAVLGPLIYYASEVKQYSSDVTVCLAIVLAMLRFIERPCPRRAKLAAAVGVIGILFSHPAFLVCAGTGLAALWQLWLDEKHRKNNSLLNSPSIHRLLIIGTVWVATFLLDYLIFLRGAISGESHPHLVEYWAARDAFMPLWPRWMAPWIFKRFWAICSEPGAMWMPNPDAGAIALFLGIAVIIARRQRRLLLVLSPLAIVVLASAVKQYPFADRLALFAVPLLIIAMAAGVESLLEGGPGLVAGILIGAIVLYPSATRALDYWLAPPGREESLGAYRWIASHWQAGDVLYLSNFAQTSYAYYKPASGWKLDPEKTGVLHVGPRFDHGIGPVVRDEKSLAGARRVWVVVIHLNSDEEEITRAGLDAIGREQAAMDHFEEGARVYFYDCGP